MIFKIELHEQHDEILSLVHVPNYLGEGTEYEQDQPLRHFKILEVFNIHKFTPKDQMQEIYMGLTCGNQHLLRFAGCLQD